MESLLLTDASNFTSKVEQVDLRSLVAHQAAVAAGCTLEEVYRHFQGSAPEYAAVLEGQAMLGLCSRTKVGFVLGSRYGFAIHGRQPIRLHLLEHALIIREGTPLREVLRAVLSRTGENFYDDPALVDEQGDYLGIISVETLVRLQSQLVTEQLQHLEGHQATLRQKNNELFRSLSELRQSQGRYAILFESSALGIALLDSRGEILAHNQRFEAMLGDQTPGNLSDWLKPEARNVFWEMLRQIESDNGATVPECQEFVLQLPRRGLRLFKFFARWIRETGQVCLCVDDITEQRNLERRLAQREKQAMLETLVSGISHELNNQLTPILGFVELLPNAVRLPGQTEKVERYCQAISASAQHSARIVRQLLQLSKPFQAEPIPCDLRCIVEDALNFARFKLREGDCQLFIDLPADPVPIVADPAQIKQVILNLVINAVDAMADRPRRELRVSAGRNHSARLLVQDCGAGIPVENLGRIFDPFFTTKGPEHGTGLGLSVCLSIIKQHGGEITVESELGTGTTFKVQLPLTQLALTPGLPEAAREMARPTPSLRQRALVVDDEEFVCALVQEILRTRMGLQVETAANGLEAIQRLRQNNFDLVVSDIRMPVLNGVGLFNWLREHQPGLAERFLFITGDEGGLNLEHAARVPLLRKPFAPAKLMETCGQLLHSAPADVWAEQP